MNLGILGTGVVGRTLGSKLVREGHRVVMGSRSAGNQAAAEWVASAGEGASQGTFADAAEAGEIVFNCTAGVASLEALSQVGEEELAGKILIDVANPLDFSHGMPPSLTVCNTDSLGEQIQRAYPALRVVKALNTMNCEVMANPGLVQGEHSLFMCGNDADAKARVSALLTEAFGWKAESILDLGDITASRGMEMVLPLWLRIMMTQRTPYFNFHIAPPAARQ